MLSTNGLLKTLKLSIIGLSISISSSLHQWMQFCIRESFAFSKCPTVLQISLKNNNNNKMCTCAMYCSPRMHNDEIGILMYIISSMLNADWQWCEEDDKKILKLQKQAHELNSFKSMGNPLLLLQPSPSQNNPNKFVSFSSTALFNSVRTPKIHRHIFVFLFFDVPSSKSPEIQNLIIISKWQ